MSVDEETVASVFELCISGLRRICVSGFAIVLEVHFCVEGGVFFKATVDPVVCAFMSFLDCQDGDIFSSHEVANVG